MTNKKVAILGDGTIETGKRIIKYLEGLGGINSHGCDGHMRSSYYLIDDNNNIDYFTNKPLDYELVTLPELAPPGYEPTYEKTFPREMLVWDEAEVYAIKQTVDGMYKDRYVVKDSQGRQDWEIFKHAKEIELPKPLTTDEKIADLQKQIDELKRKNQ